VPDRRWQRLKKIWLLGLTLLLLPLLSLARDGAFGLGVILGDPTGLSWKVWTGSKTAFAGAAAWSLGRRDFFHPHVDYLFHKENLIRVSKGRLPFYYGVGVRFLFREDDQSDKVGIRFPLGLEYLFVSPSLGVFLEFVPIFDLSPKTAVDLNGAIGVRYYF
jgi:hypothetical protein